MFPPGYYVDETDETTPGPLKRSPRVIGPPGGISQPNAMGGIVAHKRPVYHVFYGKVESTADMIPVEDVVTCEYNTLDRPLYSHRLCYHIKNKVIPPMCTDNVIIARACWQRAWLVDLTAGFSVAGVSAMRITARYNYLSLCEVNDEAITTLDHGMFATVYLPVKPSDIIFSNECTLELVLEGELVAYKAAKVLHECMHMIKTGNIIETLINCNGSSIRLLLYLADKDDSNRLQSGINTVADDLDLVYSVSPR